MTEDVKGKADPAPAAAPICQHCAMRQHDRCEGCACGCQRTETLEDQLAALQAEHARLAQENERLRGLMMLPEDREVSLIKERDAAVSRAQEAEQQHAESLAAYGEVLGDLEAARSALAQAEKERDTERSRFAYYAERFET